MFELIWGILNVVLLVYFIIISLKSIQFIKDKIGIFASLIFILGLLSFISKPEKENSTDKNITINQSNTKKAFNGDTFFHEIKLEDNLTSAIDLSLVAGEKASELIILNTYCSRSGFVSGTNWEVQNINIDKQKDKNYCTYIVTGILQWKLLGVTIYTEHKYFKGNALLKK